jgi:hypothetical protein
MIADLRSELRDFLVADATVFALIGGQRIFPVVMPQGETRTSLVYTTISETTDHVTTGASGLVMQRIQIDAYATLPDDADTLARAVKDILDGYRGAMGAIDVQGVFADTARTDYQSEPKLYRVSRDYLVWYGER